MYKVARYIEQEPVKVWFLDKIPINLIGGDFDHFFGFDGRSNAKIHYW